MTARDRRPGAPGAPESFDDETRLGMGVGAGRNTPSARVTPAAVPVAARPERSEPIVAISMKDQIGAPRVVEPRVPLQVQLRSLAEVSGRNDAATNLGRLAPPLDLLDPLDPRGPRGPRGPHPRGSSHMLVWAGGALALACVIALAIWLVAGR